MRQPSRTLPMQELLIVVAGLFMTSVADAKMPFDPLTANLAEMRQALDDGRVSSEQLVRFYLDRIARFDKAGPRINALITLNPLALEQARRLDANAPAATHRPALYGIPFIAKDNYATAGLATSGGSVVLRNSVPAMNAVVIQRLLDQGAVLVGKANMSELAASYGRLGYSSAGGLTLNPYNPARNASGSSSGSAAAVAAAFAAFALGTDTAGSVRAPASVTGLVALRPTWRSISTVGIIPLSVSFDTPGILARSVGDVAIVWAAIADAQGHEPGNAATAVPRGTTALRGLRFGVITNFRGGSRDVDAAEQVALATLRAQGAKLVDVTLPARFETLWTDVMEPVGRDEFKAPFERYLQDLDATVPHTLTQFIDASAAPGLAASTPINPLRLQALRAADAASGVHSPHYLKETTQVIPALRKAFKNAMTRAGVQILAFSTMSCAASPRFDRPDPSYACSSADPYAADYLAAIAGYPEITVPIMQLSDRLPVGYSFMGVPHSERQLLEIAAAFQRVRPAIEPPALDASSSCAQCFATL